MWFWLASRVAHTLDIDGLKARTSRRAFEQWRIYCRHFPFGDDWQQAATISAASMNPHVKRQRRPGEFIPAAPMTRVQSREQVAAGLQQWLKVYQRGNNQRRQS